MILFFFFFFFLLICLVDMRENLRITKNFLNKAKKMHVVGFLNFAKNISTCIATIEWFLVELCG